MQRFVKKKKKREGFVILYFHDVDQRNEQANSSYRSWKQEEITLSALLLELVHQKKPFALFGHKKIEWSLFNTHFSAVYIS